MKILVCPHQMVMGGSQINAIELAGAIRDRGHHVILFAPPGDLLKYAKELDLEVVESPDASSKLSIQWMFHLLKTIKSRRIDLVHAYEWGPSVSTAFSAHLLFRKPMVMTILSMDIPDFLPTHVPIVVGTRELYTEQIDKRPVVLFEPVVDLKLNSPQDGTTARKHWDIALDEFVVGIVCRLSTDLEKLQGVLEAIRTCGELASIFSVRLIIAGDGPGMGQVRRQALAVNAAAGRQVVIVTGNMNDPSSVYACSDVIAGMGSSALKGMAFAKPLVVQGANGYWKLLTNETVHEFLEKGWYGQNGNGGADLKNILVLLQGSAKYRMELGAFGRELVEERFGVQTAAAALNDLYDHSRVSARRSATGFYKSMFRSALEVAKFRTVMNLKNNGMVLKAGPS